MMWSFLRVPTAASTVKVPKVEVATTSGNKSYYAYWVEDQGVKADLAWNEIAYPDPPVLHWGVRSGLPHDLHAQARLSPQPRT